MTRLEANRKILEKIKSCVESNPDFRFNQLLWAMGIEDENDNFYRESVDTLNIVNAYE